MKQISRYLLTLALLITAAGGAWAAITTEDIGKVICTDGSLYATKILAQNDGKTAAAMIGYVDTENNKALAIALTDGNNNMGWTQACEYCTGLNTSLPVANGTWVLPTEEQWKSVLSLEEVAGHEAYKSESLNTKLNAAKGNALDNESAPYWSATESSGSYVKCFSFKYGMASVGTVNKTVADGSMTRAFLEIELSGIEVTTNAEEGETTFTEASFQMPAFDATAEYELVRDMSIQMQAQVGDGTQEQPRYRVKKDGNNKFIPADMEITAVPALFTVNDAIEQKALTQTQDYIVQIYAIDAEGQPTGDPMTFATFTFEPGIYAVKAVAAQGSDYDGETALSNTFKLCVKSDLTLTAGSDFTIDGSKATLTVDGTDKSAAIAEGKLADVDMNANVSIAANDGYVMTALSVTCGEQNVDVTTADGVSSFTMPEAPATVAYTLTRDMSVKVTTQIAERVRIQKKEGKFDAVDPFELIPILTDKIGDTDKTMVMGDETSTSADFYIKGMEKLDGEEWVEATELGVGTYRQVLAGMGNYDGTIYTDAIELYQGYEVTVPAGEFITYYKEEPLRLDEADRETIELYTVSSVSETTATLSGPYDAMPKNTPMFVRNKGTQDKTFYLIPCNDPDLALSVYSGFQGTLEPTTIAASTSTVNNYAFNGTAFVWVKNALEVGANKCWLSIGASSARTMNIVFDDATGVKEVIEVNEVSDNSWYDLNGRKLQGKPNRKGVYIKNGKKEVVK